MAAAKIKTSSDDRSRWEGRIIQRQEGLEVVVNEEELLPVSCPSLDSLERRHEASDKSWVKDWLEDQSDPARPE